MQIRSTIARGFTLIEVMIAISIAVLLLVLAAPAYSTWVADQQIRAGAESIASGMRLAHAEAIRRNGQVEFVITPTGASRGWAIQQVGVVGNIQEATFLEGAESATFTILPAGNTTVTFDGLGRVVTPNADASNPLEVIRVRHGISGSRELRVLVGGGRTGIKLCDPDPGVPAASPRFCPAP